MNIILLLLEFNSLLPIHTQSPMSDALNDANEFGGTQTLVQCLTLHQMSQVGALPLCIWEIPSSNLGLQTTYSDRILKDFLSHSLKTRDST